MLAFLLASALFSLIQRVSATTKTILKTSGETMTNTKILVVMETLSVFALVLVFVATMVEFIQAVGRPRWLLVNPVLRKIGCPWLRWISVVVVNFAVRVNTD